MMKRVAISALAVGVLALAAPAHAVDFFLIAKEFDKTLPDSTVVKMWGFAEDPGGLCWNTVSGGANSAASKAARMASANCTGPVATVPGPELVAPPTTGVAANDRVRIRLVNLLSSTAGGEGISLFIPGQAMPSRTNPGPTWTDGSVGPAGGGGPGVRRVRSFGRETAVNGGRNSYNWLPASGLVRDGTYLYHSGTHPQLQVQMGLYGAISRDASAAPDEAYTGIPYDNQVTLLYSEIDPALHAAVVSDSYGTGAGPTSTFDYQPKYFLVNGEPFTTKAAATISGPAVGERTLLRLLNAGLQVHTATLQGSRMTIVAEDANPYPAARDEHAAVLAPLKTKDAILSPTVDGTYALYDGMLNLSSTAGTASGMLSFLEVGAGTLSNTAPVAVDDPAVAGAYDVNQNNPLAVAAPGVLGNDSDADGHPLTAVLDAYPGTGTLTLNADGSFVYTNIGFSGTDSFTYRASDGVLESGPVTATITVVAVANNPPVAIDQAVTTGQQNAGGNAEAVAITLTGSDVDPLTLLTFAVTGGPTSGSLSGTEPNLTYTPALGSSGPDSFTFSANDGTDPSVVDGVVSITVEPNQAPIADVDTATVSKNTPTTPTDVTFSVTANDTDADGDVIATTVVIQRDPRHGTVVNNGDGTVTYTPDPGYTGSDTFRYRVADDDGELSRNPNGGLRTKVRVNITP